MRNNDEIVDYMSEMENIDIKSFLFRILSKWYWFVIFGFLGLCMGYLYTKRKAPTYNMTTTVLVKDKDNGVSMDKVFDGLDLGGKTSVQNHIFMLQSNVLNQEAVNNLNLDISWFCSGIFKDNELYNLFPYNVILNKNAKNLKGVNINISQISNSSYWLEIDGKYIKNGINYDFNTREKGEFGVPFESNLFNFTITHNKDFDIQKDKQYYFRINDVTNWTSFFKGRLSISQVDEKTDGIILSINETVTQRGVDYLNALTDAYLKYDLDAKNRISDNTIRFIDSQIQNIVDSLKITGNLFTEFRSKKGIVDLSQEAQQVAERLKLLQTEKELAQRKMDYFKNLQNYMNDADQMKNIAVPSVLGIADAGLNALVIKLGELYNKKSSMSFVVKEENPAIKILNNEIATCINSLGENIKNLLQNTRIELQNINSQLKSVEIKLAALPKTEQQLINIKRTFDINNELYTFLLQKRAEAAITSASNVPDAQILDRATTDTAVFIGPKVQLNLLIGLIIGLAIPFIFILLYDYFDDSIKSKDDLDSFSKVPVLGCVSHNKIKSETPVIDNPRSEIAETFRGLRYKIHKINRLNGATVFAIHSVFPNEGKTFNALNIASILAMENKKVLLVGCDLRKPRLHKIFKHKNENGLSTFLVGHHKFEEIICSTLLENLSYVNSGPIPHNPSELIGNGEFKDFIQKAQESFDYIILDNAPVGLVTDGMIVGLHAHVNMFIIRQDHSKKDQIKFINQVKEENSLKQMSIILNDTIYNGYGSSYRKYGYGSYYHSEKLVKTSLRDKMFSGNSKS